MRHLLTLIITILSVVTIACDDRQQSATSQRRSSASQKPQESPKPPTPTIPHDVSYSIIDSSTLRGIKRSLKVRLNKKVSERTLRALALKLKSQDPRNYERTFILYYPQDLKVGAGAWATTHFNPDLEVCILGLTAEQEEVLKQLPDDPSRQVIGSWIDDRMLLGNRTTIFRQNGKLFMENTFSDGSSGTKEIFAIPSTSNKKFEDKEENHSGDFYLIDSQGNLQLRDRIGLISTANKIGEDSAKTQRKRLRNEVKRYNQLTKQITELFARIEKVRKKRLLDDDNNLANQREWGIFARKFWADEAILRERIDAIDSFPAQLWLTVPLGDVVVLFFETVSEDDYRYREAKSIYAVSLQDLKAFIRQRKRDVLTKFGDSSPNFRLWTYSNGKYSVSAQLISVTDEAVQLEKKDGKKISVPLGELSERDRAFIQSPVP